MLSVVCVKVIVDSQGFLEDQDPQDLLGASEIGDGPVRQASLDHPGCRVSPELQDLQVSSD